MRLNAIKLSGFKSFVDITQFDTTAQCVGVVGPNGCGKSNIMDAVRWVLGESRAGELRGESMQDVIFNGSTTRKSAFRASVELVFDNNSGRLQGEWGRYVEVSVKRTLSRDGNSNYYINNQIVRRRDIHDMFMGTGLGPKAYAIIGQGMISRIIEAKPEDLRIFLEEAAGVSKYKERRKETQNRLEDSRENLLRVNDLINEISIQLEKLEQQSIIAKQYLSYYKILLEQEYLYLNYNIKAETNKEQLLKVNYENIRVHIEEINTKLNANEIEQQNLAGSNAVYLEQLNQAQYEYNLVNQNIIQLEERQNFQKEQQENLQQAINEANYALKDLEQKIIYYVDQQEMLQRQLEKIIIEQEIAYEQQNDMLHEEILSKQKSINNVLIQKKQIYQTYQQDLRLSQQKQQLLLQNIAQKHQKYQKLQQELVNLNKFEKQDIDILSLDLENQKQELINLNQKLSSTQEQMHFHQKHHSENTQKVQNETIEMNRLNAHLQAISSLVKNTQSNELTLYLTDNQTLSLSSLFKVAIDWENAVAVILQHRVNAYCSEFTQEIMNLLQNNQNTCFVNLSEDFPLQNLLDTSILNYLEIKNIKAKGILQQWLFNYHVCESLDYAVKHRHLLNIGHFYILKNGTLIDNFSITSNENSARQDLIHKRKIEDLKQQIKAQQIIVDECKNNLFESISKSTNFQQNFQNLQQNIRIKNQSIQEQQLSLEKILQQQEFARTRYTSYEEDIVEIQSEISLEREEHSELDFMVEELQEKIYLIEEDIENIEKDFKMIQQEIDKQKDKYNKHQMHIQALGFKEQSIKQNLNRIINDLKDSQDNIIKAKVKIKEWDIQLINLDPQIIQNQLDNALANKDIKFQTLQIAQNTIGEYHQKVQELQTISKELQNNLLPLYEKLHQIELNIQASNINKQQFILELDDNIEKFTKQNYILPNLDNIEALSLSTLKQNIHYNKSQIENLGNVNIASIQELEEVSTRHKYLIEQLEDVNQAIKTLEDAIIKIDEDTRNLLQSTFDSVNLEFSNLFPELFGGGQARLILTSDDMLYSGIQVMAQPPGKKNATIHLLSGGEKALTAIALVFAIFALNPAPFCLLDEVDAPLDDANTERYAKLIKKMSKNTQFLFISHNKIAMEMAEQLIGVTMQEQGVSRIVSVDMIESLNYLS